MNPNPLLKGLKPTHPGEVLREDILPALRRPKTEIARLLGVSRQTLYDLLDEKQPITPQMALRVGKLTGSTPEMWLNLQHGFDLRVAEKQMAAALKAIPTLEAAE
jgi:addiction module HigA family antidote